MSRVLAVLALLGASCGSASDRSSDIETDSGTITGDSSAAVPTTLAPLETSIPAATDPDPDTGSDTAPASDEQQQTLGQYVAEGDPTAVDSAWEPVARLQFVFGVAPDDRLNVRSGPGTANSVIGSLGPAATQITVFDQFEQVGSGQNGGQATWVPIQVDGGAGWVNLKFLRPEANTQSITVDGDDSDPLLSVAANAVEALGNPEVLASLVGEAGLRISIDSYLDDTEDVQLTAQDLISPSTKDVLWGYADGSGDPVERTIIEHLTEIAGSTAITSTEIIALDTQIGSGNTINNIADVYPEARIVEYYFSGTDYYGGLDWNSMYFVYDASGEQPVLIALVQAAWSI